MKLTTLLLVIALLVSPLRAQDPQRYQGGTGDGYDSLVSSDIFLDGSTLTARYQGGSGDGYDLLGSLNSFLDGGTLTARFQGGIGDGYALLASGDFPLGEPTPLVFRVERSTGDVYADGAFMPGGADLAERINVSEPVEPGDVVELDPEKPWHYRKARAYSRRVAGVITTEPGFVLGNEASAVSGRLSVDRWSMLTLLGRVPVKATTENGPIGPGDLLTVSGKPGYAMRCSEAKSCEGALVGKALEGLESGERLIMVLVMAH